MWMCIIRFFLLLLLTLQVVTAVSWLERPEPVSAAVGTDVTLRCRVTGDPGFVTWNKDSITIAIGTVNKTSIISGDTTRLSMPVATKYNLQIKSIQKSDDEDYTCTVQNLPDGQKSVTVHLTVLLPPGTPTITSNDSRPVKVENDVITLTCVSDGGNPAPVFTWTKNGKVLNSNIVETKVPKGSSSSQLTVHLDYSDHLASYSCSVQNSVNVNNPYSVSTQLQVLYHPKITFSPYRDLKIELGKTGSLSCDVSAYPAVTSVWWTKDSQSIQSTTNSRIDFQPVRKTDSGTYTCSASNTINGQSRTATETATVNVLYAPIIDIPKIYEINESATLDLTCKVDANPAAHYTRWQKTDNSIQTSDNRLIIDNIKRSHKGNYSCISRNQIKSSGSPERIDERISYTYLYVKYAPGNSIITPVSPVYVGDSLTITCSVSDPGYPAPTYEWMKKGSNQILATTTSQLTINIVTLQDNGNYTCTPKNLMGKGGTSTTHVVINEQPSFVGDHQDRDTIYNNRTGYWLQCRVRGRPEPIIQWYKNGKPLDTSGKLYRLQTTVNAVDTFSSLVTSQVYLQGSDRVGTTTPMIMDIANYTCKETSSNLEHTKELYIYFSPKQMQNGKVASIAGGSAKLTCVGEGYPVPTFVWKRNNAVIDSGGRILIYTPKFISVTKSESVLQVDRIVGQDFGEYTCETSNQFAKTSITITLTVKSKPEAPTSISCPRKNWDRVTLRWLPGFNGGSYQAFVLKYRSNPPTSGDQSARVLPDNATEFTVTNLFPNTAYEFRVCGYNELGEGDLSESITVTTDVFTFPFIKEIPEYSGDNKELTLNLKVNNTYCLKVKVSTNGGQSWETFRNNDLECFDTNVEMMIVSTEGINRMNVSVCLVNRIEVCGAPISVKISPWNITTTTDQSSTPDLSETEVIIIGCVCAAILIALLTVLVCIICRRRNLAKQMPPQTPPNLAANGHAPPQKPPRGFENTGIQGLDLVQTHGQHAGVSYINPSYSHDDYSDLNRNGYPPFPRLNGNVPLDHDTSYDPEFENEMNKRNATSVSSPHVYVDIEDKSNGNYFNDKQGDISFTGTPRSPTKDRQFIDMPSEDHKGDFNNGQESGYNTQDIPKPKKFRAKPFEAKLNHAGYYSDSVPFAHDPPGHTCGLPCCNRDLHIHLKLTGYQSCMPMPFQPKPEKQDNFSFRQKRAGLIKGRPTFSSKFNSLQPERRSQRRKPMPVFGSLRESDIPNKRLHELSGNQCHYLKERGITLPRMHLGESSTDPHIRRIQEESDDSSDSSDSETDYYTLWECNGMDSEIHVKSPSAPKSTEMIYPWTLLENVTTKPEDNRNETTDKNVPLHFKYGSLPMCYKNLTETDTNTDNQQPIKQSETKVFTLNFNNKSLSVNDKRHTLERTTLAPVETHANNETTRTAREPPAPKFSTLPRSSIRIRPILKNRIENIYTDLITSSRVQIKQSENNEEEDHNYEKIRDEDLIQNWHHKISTKNSPRKKLLKPIPAPKIPKNFYAYQNANFKTDEGNDKKCDDLALNGGNNPITLIL